MRYILGFVRHILGSTGSRPYMYTPKGAEMGLRDEVNDPVTGGNNIGTFMKDMSVGLSAI